MSLYRLRYKPGTNDGVKFASIRYPARGGWTREKAETVLAAMPVPERMELEEVDE